MRVLLVEDDDRLATVLAAGFRDRRIEIVRAATYTEARERILGAEFDVMVLDVVLPGGSGFELCAHARRHGLRTPMLMLTARDAVEDRVLGLELGADDYMVKPFAFPELLARVHALARRSPDMAPERVRIADLEVDLTARRVRRGGRSIDLTAKEFALLECFVRRPNAVIDRTYITARVWDDSYDAFDNLVDVLVRRLRKKIDQDFEPKLIQTVRGAGYRFAG